MATSLYVVGTGAIGVGLAQTLRDHAGCQLKGAWNRTPERAATAESVLATAVTHGPMPEELIADLVLVCVSDAGLPEVASQLAAIRMRHDTVVAHTSGCLPAKALGDIPRAHLGSIHPLVPFPEGAQPTSLKGGSFAIEGDPEAVELLDRLVGALAGRAFYVRAEAKPAYHAAAVMASNLVVALLGDAIATAQRAGVDEAGDLMAKLAAGAVGHVADKGAIDALTGPVLRGDVATVAQHLDVLEPDVREAYRVLSERALELARTRGLADEPLAALVRLLAKPA